MDLHRSRSCATLIQSLYDIFVHSLMLSVHIVLGLPRPLLPFILPSISNRCIPSPLIICPKYWYFLFLIVFNNDLLVFILCKTSALVLCSFHDILNILLYSHISKASNLSDVNLPSKKICPQSWSDLWQKLQLPLTYICNSCIYHIRDLRRIRRHLDLNSAELLANALVSSRFDYCNSLLSGIAETDPTKLQRVLNRLARVVTKSPPFTRSLPLIAYQ